MTTNFPTSLDALTNPVNGDIVDAQLIADLADGMEAVQARLGVTGSAVVTSDSYKLTKRPLVTDPFVGQVRVSRSFAVKGCLFTPSANMTLYGVRGYVTMATSAWTMKGHVFTVSAGAIATITSSPDYTHDSSSGSMKFDMMFASPVSLTGGTTYGLGLGYSSIAAGMTSTTDFPVTIVQRTIVENHYTRSGTFGSSVYHIASLAPAVATGVTTAANDQNSTGGAAGHATYFVMPIFDWA